ncbi:MAG: hypothetical protein KAT31_00625 [Bacteroidales bacterium]|nr:hypothetical protein [Bacteroidales bacterium]
MGKYRISLLLLAVLVAVSAYLLLAKRSGTYSRSAVEFAVKDTSQILSVEISGRGEGVILVRDRHVWRVNGSTPVRKDHMSGLLVMLSRLEVNSPASRARSEEIRKQLQVAGKQVSITRVRGPVKEYTVFHDALEGDATYMMLEESDTPFRMGVRGYNRRNLAELYVTDERFWRDNVIFQYLPEQIEYISLQNNLDRAKTYHLARNKAGDFKMSTGTVPADWFSPVEEKLHQFLGYFYLVKFEAYADLRQNTENFYEYNDEPDYVVEVNSTTGIKTVLRLFPVFIVDPAGNNKMDLNVLYAKIDDWEEMVVLKYLEIDPLLKDPRYFQSK